MNESPYFTGAAPNFGPPAGLAGLLQAGQDQRIDMSAVDKFAQAADQYKQLQNAGKSADYFFKANPDAMAAAGIHPDQLPTMSASEKSAAASGLIKAQGQQELMQKFADVAAQNKARGDFQTFVQSNPDATPQQMFRAGASAGLPMDDLYRLGQGLNALSSSGEENLTPNFIEDPQTGARFLGRGKTTLPSGVNPEKAKAAAELTPVNDAAGNLIGRMQVDVKGKSTFHPFHGGAKLQPATDGEGNPLPGFYVTPEGKIVDDRTAIQKMTGTAPTTSTPTAAAPKGDERVTIQKDGKKFTVPQSQLQDAIKQGYTQVK